MCITLIYNLSMKKNTTVENLSANLRHLMGVYGYTQEQLVKKSGVSRRTIGSALKGENATSIKVAESLAEAFGLEGWHLIMPNLPKDIEETKHLNELVTNYVTASHEGKEMIDKVAEREAKYAHE